MYALMTDDIDASIVIKTNDLDKVYAIADKNGVEMVSDEQLAL